MSMGQGANKPWKGGGALKLSKTIRGDGVLLSRGRELAVTYALDVFAGRNRPTTASGVLDGRFREPGLYDGAAVLRLEGGVEIDVDVDTEDAEGANVQARGPIEVEL